MIASFEHDFIFIKTEKTAGTSIEMALTPFCGPRDVITPISFEDERARVVDGVVQARSYARLPALEAAYRRAILVGDSNEAKRLRANRDGGFVNHMSAAEAQLRLRPEFWARALKFTSVRHPYERLVSMLFFLGGDVAALASPKNFGQLLDAIARDVLRYTAAGKLVVDRVIRYSNLVEDLNGILRTLGLAPVNGLPRAKTAARRDRRPARAILTPAQKRAIQTRCRLEFDLFDYAP